MDNGIDPKRGTNPECIPGAVSKPTAIARIYLVVRLATGEWVSHQQFGSFEV
jgi:hypothetical protein